jgi:hypothetical protein
MVTRQRTSKSVAKRHDLNYFKRGSDVRRWQWRIAAVALAVALISLGFSASREGAAMFSQGPMSSAHAVFGERCEACHIPLSATVGWPARLVARHPVPDQACLGCHVAPAHHERQVAFTPQCSSCHIEHRGAMRLAATASNTCTQCHANLTTRGDAAPDVASGIYSFTRGHPDFRALRTASDVDRGAAFGLKFNHVAHLEKTLRGPNGGSVQMVCSDCHRTPIEDAKWRFERSSGTKQLAYVPLPAVGSSDPRIGVAVDLLLHPADGRARMRPAGYRETCSGCHTLEFDEHIRAEAPHADVSTVHNFVVDQLGAYANAHPEVVQRELKSLQRTGALPQQIPVPAPHTAREWIAARVARSETILWRARCNLCHTVSGEAGTRNSAMVQALPQIEPSHQPLRFFASASFSHGAHQAVKCEECHSKAITSKSGIDLLMPAVGVCQRCHDGMSRPRGPALAAGHAESGCFLCHTYHGWNNPSANPVSAHPGFALSELLSHR